jgi:hypothetical protein
MPMTVPVTALLVAAFLELVHWGEGRFNWGPRLGSLFILLFGTVALAGTRVGEWTRDAIGWAADWLDTGVTYLLGAAAGNAAGALLHWLPAALFGAYWIAAFLPVIKERMTWRVAWVGLLIPSMLTAIPGPAGQFLTSAFDLAARAGGAVIGALFGWTGWV